MRWSSRIGAGRHETDSPSRCSSKRGVRPLPMASSGRRPGIRVGPIVVSAAVAAFGLSVWAGATVANPLRGQLQDFLNFAWLPAVLLSALMIGLAVATV